MWNRGNRLKYAMWVVLGVVVVLLATLIVAISMGAEISTGASAAILAACGVIAVALIVSSSRLSSNRHRGVDRAARSAGDPAVSGNVSNWVFLADAYVEREEFESAERLYRRAVDAGHVGALARLGEVLYELGRDDEAEYYRRRARDAGA